MYYVYIYICTCIHIYMCISIYIYPYTYTHLHIHYTHIYMYEDKGSRPTEGLAPGQELAELMEFCRLLAVVHWCDPGAKGGWKSSETMTSECA